MTAPGVLAVCGGGTGGHIFPALAVTAELRRRAPEATVHFFGREGGMEQELARRAGLPFTGLQARGLRRSLSPRNLSAVWLAAAGFWRARGRLRGLGVRAVLGTGGFVCGPVILAAASLRMPTVVHESNLIPGLTNRLLGRVATVVALGSAEGRRYFPKARTVVTGFPLRPGLNQPTREQGCAAFGLDPRRRVLFVFPGSLAAHRINLAVAAVLPQLCRRWPDLQVLWMTGSADLPLARRVVEQFSLPGVTREFIHDVPEAYAAADLVLARAGAGTLAELTATGRPALLVPYPHATGQHQTRNAATLAAAGAAEVLAEAELTDETLLAALVGVLERLAERTRAAAALRETYPQDAAERLADLLLRLAAGERPSPAAGEASA